MALELQKIPSDSRFSDNTMEFSSDGFPMKKPFGAILGKLDILIRSDALRYFGCVMKFYNIPNIEFSNGIVTLYTRLRTWTI